MARLHTGRSIPNHVPGGFRIDFGEYSCRNTKDLLGHAMVWSVQVEISEMARIMMKNDIV
jgi:hypothetical protein